MSAQVIHFPLAARMTSVILASQPPPPVGIASVREALDAVMGSAWCAREGDDVSHAVIADLGAAVRRHALAKAEVEMVVSKLEVAADWLEHARCEACCAALADGGSSLSTSWATDRAVDLAVALHRIDGIAGRLREHPAAAG